MKPLQPINHVDLNIHDVYTSRNLDHLRKFLYNNNTKKANFERSLAYNPSNLSNGISNLSYRLSKSPSNPSSQFTSLNVQFVSSSDVNRKDLLGRCLLHKLASSENEPEALEWLKVLAEHPQLQVNATDAENGWTALHRALFCGNLSFAKVLLDEIGCDIHIRDHEGMSAFALYNSTIDGACPAPAFTTKSVLEQNRTELFTWGNNRNFVLGIQGDRAHPERIHLKHPPHPNQPSSSSSQINAFLPIPVSVVAMCRLHTAVVTTTGELWICGFGSGGRLGLGWCNNKQPTGTQVHNNNITAQTQLTFARVKGALMNQRVKSVALGQDHTIIVTEAGHLYSCGLNRFGQLGYGADTMETPEYAAANSSSTNEVIQADPKRVLGPLKKEIVLGAAASKWHSACFTADALYTWGAHQGQLGYPSTSNNSQSTSIQTCPRKVTAASSPISQLTCTDYSTAFLCHNSDVFIIRSNSCIKVIFPSDRFPAHIPVYRPRDQGLGHLRIIKISAFDETLAAVSNMGDMFSLDLGRSTHSESNHAGQTQLTSANSQHHPQSFSSSANLYKPQRVWTLGKKFTAVTDAAVGMDGSIIFCTKSGHVFIHSKRTETQSSLKGGPARLGEQIKNTRNPKPTRIAHLERITKVSANPTGAFAAIREDATLNEIKIRCAAESISLPSALKALNHSFVRANEIGDEEDGSGPTENECEGEEDDHTFDWDEKVGCALIRMSLYWDSDQGLDLPLRNGDMILLVENKTILVHKILRAFQRDYPEIIEETLKSNLDSLPIRLQKSKTDLERLASLTNLSALHKSLIRMGKVVPEARLSVDFEAQLSCSSDTKDRIKPDVELKLQSDEVISCHSTLLRAQCPFFQMLYEDDAWLVSRREVGTADGDLIRLDMSHFSKRAMELVMRHIYTDGATDLFFTEGFGSLDEFIDFVCDVMAIANELLMDKLKWICSVVLRDCINLNNVTSIAAEADFYKADALKDTCMNYIICNLETIFQDKALMNIPADLLLQIGQYLKRSQQVKFPQTRCQALKEALLHSNVTFLSELDLPKSKVGETPRFWKQFLKSLSNTSSNHQPTEITSTQSVSGLNESKSTGSLPMTTGLNLSSGSPGSYGGQSLCKSVPRVSPPPPTSSSTRVTSHSIPTPPSRLIDDREPDEGPFVMDELDHSESQPLKKSEGGKHAPWEGIATQNTRVDLRSIMLTEKPSEISNVSTYNSTKASPIRMSFETPMNMKLSQREKRRISLETSKQPTIENNVQIVKPSAWRTSPSNPKSMDVGKGVLKPISFVKGNVLNNKAVGRTEIQGESFEKHSSANGKMMGTTRLSPTMNRSNHEVPSSSFVGGGSSMKTKALDQVDPASAVGAAVITPMKMSVGNRSNSVSPGFRSQKYHQDTPWTNYSSTSSTSFYASGLPIGVGSGSSPPLRIEEEGMKVSRKEATNESGVMMTTDGMIESAQVHDSKLMKFSMIQNQQETESWAIKQKCKPSLIKIQEEENDRQIEMKREVEFLKWFEEESKKYQVIEQPQEGGVNGAGGQSKGKKKVKGRKSSGGIGGWDGQIQSKGSVGLEGQSSGFGSRMKSKEKNLKVSKLNVNMNDNHNQNQKDLLNLSINDLRCEDDFKKGKRIDKRIGCGPGSGSELHCTSSKSGHFHSSQQQPLPIGNRLQQQVKSK
ncbi:uncharacterized protein MELLADRAFT_91837 [Melampsora larici-populina 98AG31]|uniref:BTB domain-containing protein n=1 Tax=Melampsora larici-populina (strain 98AG31 / pathotype 3-4-7) TaxID=747676 RepID=F4S0I7_MELLP|nr:uncharacterized protein MELLADRAFT_91837 [Melampsora larici-populina 98AG31]EGG01861.1 hypothetical protein MELLADRAFT_91837 [Melampsora larici-populina 98AG31]